MTTWPAIAVLERNAAGPLASVARSAAWLSAVFCVLVIGLLIRNHTSYNAEDLRQAQQIEALKQELRKTPKDEQLKARIRALDQTQRVAFFTRQAFAQRGTGLLLLGAALFLASAKYAATRRQFVSIPQTGPSPANGLRSSVRAQLAIGGTGLLLVIGIVWLLSATATPLTASVLESGPGNGTVPTVKPAALPTRQEYCRHWPRFRGPNGSGVSQYTNVPLEWDHQSGKNILWKAVVPLGGESSPLVWGERIFLTGGTESLRQVFAYDLSGKLLWQREVGQTPAKPLSLMDNQGAASTAATDGLRLYVIFATGDLACFDFDGKQLWTQRLGVPENAYGYATSLLTWGHLLLVLFDQGSEEDNRSKLYAYNGLTGQLAWQVARPVGESWATPLIVDGERPQLLTLSKPWVIAYDPNGGKELWRAKSEGNDVAPSPVFDGTHVYALYPHAELAAFRIDGSGDVTSSHKAWSATDNIPDICSPVADGQRVYLLTSEGRLTCFGAKKGQKLWEHDLEGTFKASPSIVGSRLLVTSEGGRTYVLDCGDQFKELGRAELGEKIQACFAFADGRIYVRGEHHLFAIGAGGATR